MGLTAEIGAFVSSMRFARVPTNALTIVRTGFTDCVAVMIAGARETVTRVAAAHAGLTRAAARGILLGELRGPAPGIALAYGAAAHALDYDDTAFSSHPSAVLVPAVLAEAAETPATGAQLVAGYVAGYEVWAELILRDQDPHHLSGFHPSAVFGTIAAAAAAAALRGQDAVRAQTTVAIAASFAGGVSANFGSMTKPFQVGRAAQSGLQAARLSEAGLTASPDAVEHQLGFLRAVSPKGNVDTQSPAALGRTWHIHEHGVNVKLYPMCYGTHCILDGMLDLAREHRLTADGIASVHVELAESTVGILRNHRPQSTLEAKFSAEFAIAAAAIAGRCTGTELEENFIRRPDVQRFIEKVQVTPTKKGPADRVTVRTVDGQDLRVDVEVPRGHFKRAADAGTLWEKFADCTRAALDPREARHLFDRLQRIDEIESVADLTPPARLQGTG